MNRRFFSGLPLLLLPVSLLSGLARADLLDTKITLDVADKKASPGELNLFEGQVSLDPPDKSISQLAAALEKEKEVREETQEAPGEARLPADLRDKWRAFFARSRNSCRSQWESDLRNAQKRLVEKAKLDEAAAARLKAVADAAIHEGVKAWEPWFAEEILTRLELSGEAASLLDSLGPRDTFNSFPLPEEMQPVRSIQWLEGIKQIVDPQILTDLDKEREDLRKRIVENLTERMEVWEEPARQSFGSALFLKLDQLQQFAGLDEEKNKALKKAADEAVSLAVSQWRGRCVSLLMSVSDAERQNYLDQETPLMLSPRGFGQKPEYMEEWLKARNELISADALTKMEESRSRVKARREQALAKLTLAEMERVIGFTPAQREALLAEALFHFKTLPTGYYEKPGNQYSSIDMPELLERMKKIPAEFTSKVLTKSQVRRWTALTVEQLNEEGYSSRRESKSDSGESAPPDLDEAGAQRLIAQLLEQEAAKLRLSAYNQMEARAEMVIFSARLEPAVAGQIRTAAKGTAESTIRDAVAQLEQNILSQFRNVKPAEVPKRLKNISFATGFNRRTEAEPALWTASLQRLLTDEQRKILASEQKEQARWLQTSISEILVTDINRSVALAPDKMEALQKKVEELMDEYGEDINRIFSRRWYLQGYYGAIPLALLSDKEMGEYFTPSQLELLRRGALGRAGQYSAMIKQQHKQRTKKK